MKRIMKAAWILAASALAFSSCVEEQALAPQDEQAGKTTVNITAGTAGTKTQYDETTQIKWEGGETIELLENGTDFANVTSDAGTASSDGLTAKFTASLTSGVTGPFEYYAIYPSTSYPSSSNANVAEIKLVHPNLQNPTATSFDPKADLLVSQKQPAQSTQPTDLNFQFARPIAIMEMTLKGLPDGEKINSVEFSSKTAILSGRMKYDFTNDKVVSYGYINNELKSITCNYTDYQTASAGNKIYFTVFPTGENPALADFTVTVDTDNATYTKTVTPPTALTIKPNDLVKFSVAKLERTAKVTDKYTLLTDASKLGEGDKILIVAEGSAGTVAMAGENADADIRLTVPVTINTDKTITALPEGLQIIELLNSKTNGEFTLRTSNAPVRELEHHGTGNNLFTQQTGSSWSIYATAEGVTKISTNNNTRFIQYNYNGGNDRFAAYKGTQTDVQIFYKKGTPRRALATPQNLYAEQEDVNVNSATVIWDGVTEAASYTVTCGENVQIVYAPETSATIVDLAWGTTQTVTVVANPDSTSETLKSSDDATTKVTIGANPNAQVLLKDGDYVVMCKDGATYKALTSTASKFNLAAAELPYDGSAQEVIATKDLIWHIVYDKQKDAYSFEQAGKYMVAQASGSHMNATLSTTPGFHKLTLNTDNTFTIGATDKLWYKSRFTEFTFDGTPDNGKDQLLIISAKVDETPVISFEKTAYTLESTLTSLSIPFTRNAFATGDVTVDVTAGGDWLNVTSKTIQNPTTKIACTFNANDTGAERTATLTVKHANAKNQVITVKQLAAGTVNPTTVTVNWNDVASQYNLTDESDLPASLAFDAFTFSWDANSGTKPRTWSNNSEMRLYKNNIMTIKATDASKKITKIVMKLSASANTGTYNGSTWTGSADSVIFTVSSKAKTQKVSTIEITYE